FIGPEAHAFTAGRGLAHTERMLEVLACVRPCTTQPFDTLRGLLRDRHTALSGAICVLLAWDRERQALIRDLEMRRVPPLALGGGEAPSTGSAEDAAVASGGLHFLPVGRVAEGLARL